MATDTVNIFDEFFTDLPNAEQDLLGNTDTVKVALTNSAPAGTEANWNTTDFPEPTGSGYTAGGETITYTGTETTGTFTMALTADVVWTATASDWTAFRYAVFYNSSSTSPTNAAIGWIDYGSSITLSNTETFTISSGTILTIS